MEPTFFIHIAMLIIKMIAAIIADIKGTGNKEEETF